MLILLKYIRKKLLWLWIGFSIPILLLVLIQTINGKFEGIVSKAWLWVGINLLPTMLLLMISAIQNKYPGKMIQKSIFKIIWLFSLIYLVLLIMTQFGLSAGTVDKSIEAYFQQSYYWLLPFQLIILGVYSLLFFKKEAVFQPNEKLMKSHFQEKADKAKSNNNLNEQSAYEKLVAGDFKGVFSQLKSDAQGYLKDQKRFNMALQLEGRYNKWKENSDMGLLDTKEANTEWNQIYYAVINLIDDLYPDN